MWRTAIAAVLVYGYGHSAFDGMRPAALDRPLQAFHAAANETAREGHRVLTNIESSRAKHYLTTYIERIENELRPSDHRAAAARTAD
jgi:hypothetical protein